MKICHATDFLPRMHTSWGGAELAALNLINLLQSHENKQIVLSTKPLREVHEHFDFFAVPVLNDVLGKVAELVKCWTFDPIAFKAAYEIFKMNKPDVLHLHNFRTMSFALVEAAKRHGIPVVFSIYDNWCLCPNHTLITSKNELCKTYHGLSCFSCTYSHKKISSFFRRPFFNYFLNKIDAFIVLSQGMKEMLRHYGIPKDKIFFIPLPLAKSTWESEHAPEVDPEPNSILFCGWLSIHKGLKILIRALPDVVNQVPDVKLYVIETGVDPSYKEDILNYIKENRLEQRVFFLGKKKNEEVQAYLKRCELVVVPEQWGIAWPIFLTEAMFAEKGIIASDIGDIPNFIQNGKNGFTVKANDSKAFAKKILHCLMHKEELKVFGRLSQGYIIELCNDRKIYQQLMDLYQKFCPERREGGGRHDV